MRDQAPAKPDLRVIVMEDHSTLCDVLSRKVSKTPGLICCGHFDTGQATLDAVFDLRPDLVSLDLTMPDVNGLAVLRQIRERCPEIRCIVFSGHADDAYVRHSFEIGAMGYVFKEDIDDFIEAIRVVAAGDYFISARFEDSLSLEDVVTSNGRPEEGSEKQTGAE